DSSNRQDRDGGEVQRRTAQGDDDRRRTLVRAVEIADELPRRVAHFCGRACMILQANVEPAVRGAGERRQDGAVRAKHDSPLRIGRGLRHQIFSTTRLNERSADPDCHRSRPSAHGPLSHRDVDSLANTHIMPLLASLIDLYSLVVLVAVILSWVPLDRRNPLVAITPALPEPVLASIRRILPPMAGLDLSPMVLLIALQLLKGLLV